MSSYQRAYRIAGFGSIGLILMIFSVALSRSLGLTGFLLPWLLVGIAYLVVDVLLELLIDALELRAGLNTWRYERTVKRRAPYRDDWSNAGPLDEDDGKRKRK